MKAPAKLNPALVSLETKLGSVEGSSPDVYVYADFGVDFDFGIHIIIKELL